MNTLFTHSSLSSYVRAVDTLIHRTVEAAGLEPDQTALIAAGIATKSSRASRRPLSSHSLAPLYLTIRAHGVEVRADAEVVGAGLMIFYFALDLFDSVQDDELDGRYAEAGPELAINCAITLLLLSQDMLGGFVRALPSGLRARAAGMLRACSLRSVRGQHRDLTSRGRDVTLAGVRTTSVEKSALCALRMEYAGVYVASTLTPEAEAIDPRFREIGDGIAEIRQMVNDVADLFDGDRSEDLRQRTMSMPLAMFVEQTGEQGRAVLEAAREQPLGELEVQRRVHGSGIMRRVAAQTEAVRVRVHEAFAALPCSGPHLALLLGWLDDLPSIYYRPPSLRIAVDVDGVDTSSMSDPDRELLDGLRRERRARTTGASRPAQVPPHSPTQTQESRAS